MRKINSEKMAMIQGGVGICGPGPAKPKGVVAIQPGICILFLIYGGWCNATDSVQRLMRCDNGDGTGYLVLLS